jgi:hypothetical protein
MTINIKFSLNAFLIFTFLTITEVVAQHRPSVSAAEVNGTFRNKQGSEFQILAIGNGRLKIHFFGVYPYRNPTTNEELANTGEAEGIALIEADAAVFKPTDFESTCIITMTFVKNGLMVVKEQGESCGFGLNVTAAGSYYKVSSRKPVF